MGSAPDPHTGLGETGQLAMQSVKSLFGYSSGPGKRLFLHWLSGANLKFWITDTLLSINEKEKAI